MLERGHPDAIHYPICVLAEEAAIIHRRDNNRLKTEAILTQGAVISVLSEDGADAFNDILGRLK